MTSAALPRPAHARGSLAWSRRGAVLLRVALPLAVLNAGYVDREELLGQVLVLFALLFLPGHLLLTAVAARTSPTARIVYSLGLSLGLVMATGLATNTLLDAAGRSHPLARSPLWVALNAVVLVLAVAAARRERLTPLNAAALLRGLPLLLPAVVSAAGAELLNNGEGNAVAVVAVGLTLALVLGLFLLADRLPDLTTVVGLYGVASSLIVSFCLRGDGLFGYDVRQEFRVFTATHDALVWHPVTNDPYTAMLSITVLPTELTQIAGVAPLWIFKLVFPLVAASIPCAVFVLARRFVSSRFAVVAAFMVILQYQFAQQLPGLGRQAVALAVFAAFCCLAFDADVPFRTRQAVLAVLGFGVVVAHYSTADLAAATTVLAALGGVVAWRRNTLVKPGVGLLLALALAAFTFTWRVPITHSGQNATDFLHALETEGPNLLPNKAGGPLQRFLGGNVNAQVNGSSTASDQALDAIVAARPWLKPYSPGVQAQFLTPPVAQPVRTTPLSPVAPAINAWVIVVAQVINALQVLGLVYLWRRGKGRFPFRAQLLLWGAGFVAIEVVARFSGTVAQSYNLERLVLQALFVTSVPAVILLERLLAGRRWHWYKIGLAAVAACLLVFGSHATGLQQELFGGGTRVNLTVDDDESQRATEHEQDIRAATWVGAAAAREPLIFTDVYGRLELLAHTTISSGMFTDLTGKTIDQRAWVFATRDNIDLRTGRVALPGLSVTYTYPTDFLERFKGRMYDNGSSRVYG